MLENVQFFGENKQIFLKEMLENVQFFLGEYADIFERNVGECAVFW